MNKGEARMLVYHIGKRAPRPRPAPPNSLPRERRLRGHIGRVVLGKDAEAHVFVTTDWKRVMLYHNKFGNVYKLRTTKRAVALCGGASVYDKAPEIVVPERHWHLFKLVGRIDEREALKELVASRTISTDRGKLAEWETARILHLDMLSKKGACSYSEKEDALSKKVVFILRSMFAG